MEPSYNDLLVVADRAARAGAEELLKFRGRFEVHEKGPADLVTDADLASEAAIRSVVTKTFPDHALLGEETGDSVDNAASEYRWIADPLDGTTNYVHGIPFYCVSLAVHRRGEPVAGVVFDPNRGEMFTATRGGGAFLNGKAISAGKCPTIHEAVLAISLPPQRVSRWEMASMERLLPHSRTVLRLGSAALILCYVAAGRINGYWASSLNLWDRAAGELIVSEAGGLVTDLEGRPLRTDHRTLLAAGDPRLHGRLHDEIAAVREE